MPMIHAFRFRIQHPTRELVYRIITTWKTYLILSAAFLAIEGSTLYSKPDPPNVMISM